MVENVHERSKREHCVAVLDSTACGLAVNTPKAILTASAHARVLIRIAHNQSNTVPLMTSLQHYVRDIGIVSETYTRTISSPKAQGTLAASSTTR